MVEPLDFLWPAVEAANPLFARAAIIRWPHGVHEKLTSAGLIVPHGTASRIRCPECGETHVGVPFTHVQTDGTTRSFIHCPKHVRAEVTDRDLQQWIVSIESLAAGLSTSLKLSGKVAQLNSDRVWRCGRWMQGKRMRDVLFARGLRRHDAVQFRRAITGSHFPVVFVGSEIPDPDYWQGGIPPLIRLREVATLINGNIETDVTQVIGLINAADKCSESDASSHAQQRRKEVRRAVKAEVKSLLSDDQLVAAYRQYGSYTKAAAGLKQQGVETNRYAVAKAVDRAGGIKAVRRGDDSESIVRSRSSQRRDTPRKNEK